jgi:hypothetical protein
VKLSLEARSFVRLSALPADSGCVRLTLAFSSLAVAATVTAVQRFHRGHLKPTTPKPAVVPPPPVEAPAGSSVGEARHVAAAAAGGGVMGGSGSGDEGAPLLSLRLWATGRESVCLQIGWATAGPAYGTATTAVSADDAAEQLPAAEQALSVGGQEVAAAREPTTVDESLGLLYAAGPDGSRGFRGRGRGRGRVL